RQMIFAMGDMACRSRASLRADQLACRRETVGWRIMSTEFTPRPATPFVPARSMPCAAAEAVAVRSESHMGFLANKIRRRRFGYTCWGGAQLDLHFGIISSRILAPATPQRTIQQSD